jgi:hypothetical protein
LVTLEFTTPAFYSLLLPHNLDLIIVKSRLHTTMRALYIALLFSLIPFLTFSQSVDTSASKTQIVMLGTGTPSPDPERSGPATAIVVNGTPYLIDFGPGVVRRASAASQKGVKASRWPTLE